MKKKIISLQSADKIDLEKYQGKWFEIASFPAWFSKECINSTAEYKLKENHVEVLNKCDVKGKFEFECEKGSNMCKMSPVRKVQKGKAFKTGEDDLLKVQFFWPFKANYKIEFVDENYQYAVVGGFRNNYLWILARNERIDDEVYEFLVSVARNKGYDVDRLVKTRENL